MTAEQQIHDQIVHRHKEGIEALLDDALTYRTAADVLHCVLLPAMREVGEKFGAGALVLPHVLQSAEVMQKALAHLKPFLDRKGGLTKGQVVLATVAGDVHNIGRHLVNTVLASNGYTVYDLGNQVPVQTIIERAVEVGADAIGLSALLASTSRQMQACVQELHRRGLQIPVLVGGPAIHRRAARQMMWIDADCSVAYTPGVFYCRDALEGLAILDQLVDPQQRTALIQRAHNAAVAERQASAHLPPPAVVRRTARSATIQDAPIPQPPFWGYRVLRGAEAIPLSDVFACLDQNALFRGQWRYRGRRDEWQALVERTLRPRLAAMQQEAVTDGWLRPAAIYGYYPCHSLGNDLVIFNPAAWARAERLVEIARFTFPRQAYDDHLCLADYFMPADAGRVDVAALQVVTVGERATALVDQLQRAGEYLRAYYIHGLAVQYTEALAEWLHRHLRREMKLPPGQGRRYSWGYPACPDLAAQQIVFRILPAREELGITLTSAHQLVPEQSTAALVVHHPQAKHFSVGSRYQPNEGTTLEADAVIDSAKGRS